MCREGWAPMVPWYFPRVCWDIPRGHFPGASWGVGVFGPWGFFWGV